MPVPPNVYTLILETFEGVTLYDKRDFEDIIKLKILRWEK